jgi:hypothetical protein
MKKIIFILFFLPTLFVFAQNTYQPLAPIPGLTTDAALQPNESGLAVYFENLYKFGVGIATALALIMVILGGVEYVSTDAIGGKEEGKERIQNALLGMLLALGSYLILQTIDRSFVQSEIRMERLEINIEASVYADNNFTPEDVGEDLGYDSSSILADATNAPISQGASGIVETATAYADPATGLVTRNAPGTAKGNLACAYAVSTILNNSGYNIPIEYSTIGLNNRLASDPRFQRVNSMSEALPGDIIISPTAGENRIGHTGVCIGAGCSKIVSNSSKNGRVLSNHTASSWNNHYSTKKQLPVYIYRPK